MARSSSFSKGVGVARRAQQQAEHVVAVQPLHRLDQDLLAAVLVETRRAKDEMAAVGHAQLAGQPDQPVGAHDGRIEAVEVDAGRNGLQPAFEGREVLQRIARDMFRHRDHRVGARLAALDEAARQASGHERQMQRGDPLDLEPARQRTRHPRGGGERAWISETRASRRLAASLRGKVSRAHSGWRSRAIRDAWRAAAAGRAPGRRPARRRWPSRRPRSRLAPRRAWRAPGRRRRG